MPDFSVRASQDLLRRLRSVDALIDGRPNVFFGRGERVGGYPLFVERARGAYVWDADGNRYIDFLLGYGSVVLGHAHPAVVEAVSCETASLGPNPTFLSKSHLNLAEAVTATCPNVDQVAFLKTGSDATSAATRLARAITQRSVILRWGMNGWHDWCAPVNTGVPRTVQAETAVLTFNDLDRVAQYFEAHGSRVACALMMPFELELPVPGFLEGVRDLCHKFGALFVLDEVRSGFRVALGGAQELLGVDADLVTYGKALANGYAISCLGGRRDLMRHMMDVGVTVTYIRGPESMAAGVATIAELKRTQAPKLLERLGLRFIEGMNRAARDTATCARAIGLPWTPFLKFELPTSAASERAMQFFCNAMLPRGVLMTPWHHWFVCTSMSEDDIDYTIEAASEVFKSMQTR